MCVMASLMHSGETRHSLFKRLLNGATPQNPTYILSRAIAEFQAQSPTELSVTKGEEIFILFEINEWAFATVFSDTSRKGYVPLDYCDVIKDFYEQPDGRREKAHRSPSKCKRYEDRPSQQHKGSGIDGKLSYYETTHLQSTNNQHSAHLSGSGADYSENRHLQSTSIRSESTNLTCNRLRLGELYGEQTTLGVTVDSSIGSVSCERTAACCCCCDKRRCGRNKLDQYNNVLHYINCTQALSDSHLEDSESGLGDSESILSFCDIPLTSSSIKTDVFDIATQTSKSLENLQDSLDKLSLDPAFHQTPSKPLPNSRRRCCTKEKERLSDHDDLLESKHLSQSTSTTSPPPSIDSLFSDSGFRNSPTDVSTLKSDSDEETNSLFDREDFATVKRKREIVDKNTSRVVLSLEQSKIEDNTTLNNSELPNNHCKSKKVKCDSSSTARYRHLSATDLKRRLSIPILEEGKKPNRVELTRLSMRIKEKLRPARDELLQKRSDEKHQHKSLPDVKPQQSIASKCDIDGSRAKPLDNPVESDGETHNKEIKEREITFQSIQQQYMKLEEARLLHNALKHLNDAIAVQGDAG